MKDILKKTLLEMGIFIFIGVVFIVVIYFVIDDEDEQYYLEDVIDVIDVRIEESYLTLEIADDESSRALGLMHREELAENEGMIFVYEDEGMRSFWMKNVLISLDMIFIDSEFEVVGILENVPPCEEEPCETYSIDEKAQYVVEVNAGWVEENDINVGDKAEFIVQDPFGS